MRRIYFLQTADVFSLFRRGGNSVLKKNDIVELTITDMSFEGMGVARYSDEEVKGFVVFVHNAVVGDLIDCRIVKVLAKMAYGIVEQILAPSADRIVPSCGYFPKCGGCTHLNARYETELIYKKNCVTAAFRNNCPEVDVTPEDPVPSPVLQHYRNKIICPLSSDLKFGFFARHSHRIVPVENCGLQDPDFEPIIRKAEAFIQTYSLSAYDEKTGRGLVRNLYLRKAHATGEIMVCLVINGRDIPHKEQFTTMISACPGVKSIYININREMTNVVLGKTFVHLWGQESLTDILCGLKFRIGPRSFYQINSEQTENLYRFVAEQAGLTKEDTVLDLYCGIGTIALSVAGKVKNVLGIEAVPQAVDNACENAELNKIRNAEFYPANAENLLEVLRSLPKFRTPDVVIVDPPRKGLGEKTIAAIQEISPQKLIYISCNPATQARDISLLNRDGAQYRVDRISPFDMFPRTGHIETVALLSRKEENLQ